jgi:hypothetical protein
LNLCGLPGSLRGKSQTTPLDEGDLRQDVSAVEQQFGVRDVNYTIMSGLM